MQIIVKIVISEGFGAQTLHTIVKIVIFEFPER